MSLKSCRDGQKEKNKEKLQKLIKRRDSERERVLPPPCCTVSSELLGFYFIFFLIFRFWIVHY